MVDADSEAFDAIVAAHRLPADSASDVAARAEAIQAATRRAIEVPLQVMEVSLASMDVIEAMAKIGNPASASDAGVGALCARTAVLGAELNVRINVGVVTDEAEAKAYVDRASRLRAEALDREQAILELVEEHL